MADAPTSKWEFPPYTKTIHRKAYPAIEPTNPANSAKGKVVVVTGGGTGIGKEIARYFILAGAKGVALIGRRDSVLQEAKRELKAAGSAKIAVRSADVTSEASTKAAFDGIASELGKIDVVVANAGYYPSEGPASIVDIGDWWKGYEINVLGTLLSFRAWLPHAPKTGADDASKPVFISINTGGSHAGVFPNVSSYGSSKLAALQLCGFLAAENPAVRVVSLAPGVVATDMAAKSEVLTFSKDDISLPAGFTVWLASPNASWTTGRFFWAHWDVDELEKMREEIISKNELTLALVGWPKQVEFTVVN